jgi:hypothetical protein
LGCALALVELENSSDQTSVPEGMAGVKFFVATLLLVEPLAVTMALIVRVEATRIGAWYCCEEVVGVVPSRV